MPIYLMSIRVLLSVELCVTLKTYLKRAPFYNAWESRALCGISKRGGKVGFWTFPPRVFSTALPAASFGLRIGPPRSSSTSAKAPPGSNRSGGGGRRNRNWAANLRASPRLHVTIRSVSDMGSRVENRRSNCSLPVDIRRGFRRATSVRFGLVLFPVPAHRTVLAPPAGRHEEESIRCFSPTLPPRKEGRMRINDRIVLNSRLLQHGWGSSRLDGLAQHIFLTPEQWSDDSKCVQFFPYFREFKFLLCEHFVYGFHSDGEVTPLDGKLDGRIITRSLWRVDATELLADAAA